MEVVVAQVGRERPILKKKILEQIYFPRYKLDGHLSLSRNSNRALAFVALNVWNNER